MISSFALNLRRLTLVALCSLPLINQAAPKKEAPLDLSIIKQSNELRPLMTRQQQIAFLDAKALIKKGESDIRSGLSLQQQKPSALDPDRDMRPIHERGKQTVAAGEATVREGQKQMIELLTAVKTAQMERLAVDAKKYNFDLVGKDYTAALESAATQTLEACLDAGYKNVFFDGVRVITAESDAKAAPHVHNTTYDIFTKADAKSSLTVPFGLQLAIDETTGNYTFQYDNSSVFEGEQAALLAIEWIAPGSGVEALLSVRAFDLDSQQLISSELFYVADASAALSSEPETTPLPAEAAEPVADEASVAVEATPTSGEDTVVPEPEVAAAPRTMPLSVTFDMQNELFKKLAGLPTPYSFEVITTVDNSAQAILIDNFLKDTLLKHSPLALVDSAYIQRAYLPAVANTDKFSSAATAGLTVAKGEGNYTIEAKAYDSGRSLEVGTMTPNLPESGEE